MSKCSNCGSNASASAKFCRGCGFPLASSSSSSPSPSSSTPKSNLEVAAGAFKLLSGGAEPPKITPQPAAPAAAGGAVGGSGIVASYCMPRVLTALKKEEAAQTELNSKFNAVVKMFVGKNTTAIQAFLSWISSQAEHELINKLTFARSKVGADNQAFASLVPVVCPELTDLGALAKNNAAKFEMLYWSIMGEGLEMLLMGSSKGPEAVPVPPIDPSESVEKQTYAKMMHELKATLESMKADDDAGFDALLQKHRAHGGDAVVMIFEYYLKTHAAPSDVLFIFRRLRCQLLFRFFVLLLSFYLNEKDAKK